MIKTPRNSSRIRRGRRGSSAFLLFPRPVAAIDDHARLFPGGDEGAAGGRRVELHHQIVDGFDQAEESGHAGRDFALERAAAGNLSARRVDEGAEGGDGIRQRGDAGRVHAASGGAGLGAGGLREVADEGAGGDQGLIAQFLDAAFFEIDLGEIGRVAGLAKVRYAGAGDDVGGVFEGGFGAGLGVGGSGGGGVREDDEGADGLVFAADGGEVAAKVERGLDVPDGVVFIGVIG